MEMSAHAWQEMREALRDVLEEELGMGDCPMARRFSGGTLILKPCDDTAAREIPLEAFFKKLTSVREKLRVLEQKINNHDRLSHEDKAEFQLFITRAYGSLTTFNLLFREERDRFTGQKTDE